MGSKFEVDNNGNVDLKNNLLKNAARLGFQNLSSDPASPVEGQLYYNTTSKKLRIYNGTAWTDLSGVPWGNNADVSLIGQFPSVGGNNTGMTLTLPKIFNTAVAVYSGRGGSSSSSGASASPSNIYAPVVSQNILIAAGYYAFTKDQLDQGMALYCRNNTAGGNMTLRGLLYATSSISTQSFTDNGHKFISGGGNPETDWNAAAAHGTEPDSAVQKITMTNANSYSHIMIAKKATVAGSSGLQLNFYVWNFNSDTWEIMPYVEQNDSGFGRPVLGLGFFTTADHINASKEIYIRVVASGSSPTISAKDVAVVIYGDKNPQD